MKTVINLSPTPNQSVAANLTTADGNIHTLEITLRTMPSGYLIANLSIDQEPVFYGRRCVNLMPLMLSGPIPGNFYFMDKYGNNDPDFRELGDRYVLVYDDNYELN